MPRTHARAYYKLRLRPLARPQRQRPYAGMSGRRLQATPVQCERNRAGTAVFSYGSTDTVELELAEIIATLQQPVPQPPVAPSLPSLFSSSSRPPVPCPRLLLLSTFYRGCGDHCHAAAAGAPAARRPLPSSLPPPGLQCIPPPSPHFYDLLTAARQQFLWRLRRSSPHCSRQFSRYRRQCKGEHRHWKAVNEERQ